MFWDFISAPYLRPVALETKMTDAQVEYKHVAEVNMALRFQAN